MKQRYYYLLISLKDVVFDSDRLPHPIAELIDMVETEVKDEQEAKLFKALRLHYDNVNLVNLLEKKQDEEFAPFGLFTQEKLQEEIQFPQELPVYMLDFIEAFKNGEREFPALSIQDELTIRYYRYLVSFKNDFLREYVTFDYYLKNVLTALTLKKYKMSAENKVLMLDELSQNLVSNTQEGFGLIHDFDWMRDVLDAFNAGNPLDRERRLAAMRFAELDRLSNNDFTVENILAYFIKLIIVERWTKLKEEAGLKILDEVTGKLSDDKIVFAES